MFSRESISSPGFAVDENWHDHMKVSEWTLTSLDMNAELAFLVFILYCVLFLDLYNSLTKSLNANSSKKSKKSWLSRRNHCSDIMVTAYKRSNLLTRSSDFEKENAVRSDVLSLQSAMQQRSTNRISLKTRSWGRS